MNKNNLALYLFEKLSITEFYFNDDDKSYYFIYLGSAFCIKYNENTNTITHNFKGNDIEYNEYGIETLINRLNIKCYE